MKALFSMALALLTGVAVGAFFVQRLNAQTKPPAFVVTEIDISNMPAYQKEYVPLTQASIRAAGGRLLAGGQNLIALDGAPPQTRVSINQFDSLQAVQNWRQSEQYKAARKVGDKYAKFRAFAVEGYPQ